MSPTIGTRRPPLGIRLLHTLRKEPDWLTMSPEALAAFRDAENRRRASGLTRVISGFPDRGATIDWRQLALPNRVLPVRMYRPSPGRGRQDAGARASARYFTCTAAGSWARRCRATGSTVTSLRDCRPWSCRSSTVSSHPRSRCPRRWTTAGTHCVTWSSTPRGGESTRRESPSSERAPVRWSPPWPRSGPGTRI